MPNDLNKIIDALEPFKDNLKTVADSGSLIRAADSGSRQQFNLEKLFTYAKICRAKNIMTPYLEAGL